MSAFPEGYKLFVGGLPGDITREDLYAVFPTYGEVTGVHVMPAEKSKTGQACAFVTYKTREAAEDAIQVLDGKYRIREGDGVEPIKVAWPRNKDSDKGKGKSPDPYPSMGGGCGPPAGGYGGGFDGGKGCGAPNYGKAGGAYPPPPQQNGGTPGFQAVGIQATAGYPNAGVVQAGGFAQPGGGCAGAAWQAQSQPGYQESWGKGGNPACGGGKGWGETQKGGQMGFQQPMGGAGGDYGKGKAGGGFGGGGGPFPGGEGKLFVGNLPTDITEDALKYVFQNYGKVERVHIMTGRAKSGQSCAFVEYSSLQEAETAILTLHEKYEIRPGEGVIVVKKANSGGRGKAF